MNRSESLFTQAQKSIPGGVNSPVRAFKGVSGSPLFFKSASGARVTDADGKSYIDYVGSWGPMVAGHSHPDVIAAISQQLESGISFGAPTELETEMAETLCRLVPSLELVRMVNSGTEATMSAIRLARGYTKRDKILKFEGCYHGHVDALLVKAGSGALTTGEPTSPGISSAVAANTIVADYNSPDSVAEAFAAHGDELACAIFEPVAGNMNCIPPTPEFLDALQSLCKKHGALLICDEVMTGFRVALGGAQSLYNIDPDLSTFGKVVGGGMPVGAFGGKREVMQHISPLGPVYQAGTLSGNPLAMAAGLANLTLVEQANFYQDLEKKTQQLCDGLQQAADNAGIKLTINQVCGMFGLFFTEKKQIQTFADVMTCDTERFKAFHKGMLTEGIYLAPSAFETGFMSNAHNQEEITETIRAAEKVFASL